MSHNIIRQTSFFSKKDISKWVRTGYWSETTQTDAESTAEMTVDMALKLKRLSHPQYENTENSQSEQSTIPQVSKRAKIFSFKSSRNLIKDSTSDDFDSDCRQLKVVRRKITFTNKNKVQPHTKISYRAKHRIIKYKQKMNKIRISKLKKEEERSTSSENLSNTSELPLPEQNQRESQVSQSTTKNECNNLETFNNTENDCPSSSNMSEGDVLDPIYDEPHYKTIIIPSDCERDILDSISSVTEDNCANISENMSGKLHESDNHKSLDASNGTLGADSSSIFVSITLNSSHTSDGSKTTKPCYDSMIVSKNENFDSSHSDSDNKSQKPLSVNFNLKLDKTPMKKVNIEFNSTDSVDTMIYIKNNQQVRRVKSKAKYKKNVRIPYKVIVTKAKDTKISPYSSKILTNGDIFTSSNLGNESTLPNSETEDEFLNKSTSDDFISIVMPTTEKIENDDLNSFFQIENESCEGDVLDRSFDLSHLRIMIMPATEDLYTEDCETDILDEKSEISTTDIDENILQTSEDDEENYNIMTALTSKNRVEIDALNTVFKEVLDANKSKENKEKNYVLDDTSEEGDEINNTNAVCSSEGSSGGSENNENLGDCEEYDSDDYEEVASLTCFEYDPSMDWSKLVEHPSDLKTIDEVFYEIMNGHKK